MARLEIMDYNITKIRQDPDYIFYYLHWTRLITTGVIPFVYLLVTNLLIWRTIRSWEVDKKYWSTKGFRRKEAKVLTTSEDSLATDYQMKMVKMPDAKCQMVERQPSQYSIRTHRVSPASRSG